MGRSPTRGQESRRTQVGRQSRAGTKLGKRHHCAEAAGGSGQPQAVHTNRPTAAEKDEAGPQPFYCIHSLYVSTSSSRSVIAHKSYQLVE